MPRRVLWFLVSIALVTGLTILVPIMSRLSDESTSLNTSVSVSPFGFKALYLLLEQVQNRPVAFWQHSMMGLSPEKPRTVWFMEPGPGLFHDGDVYGNHMRKLAEGGHHLVFVLDSRGMEGEQPVSGVLKYVNGWFGLNVSVRSITSGNVSDLSVISHFPTRQIEHLSYRPVPKEELADKFRAYGSEALDEPELVGFEPEGIENAQVLLETANGDPLIVRFPVGKGSVTIFPNAYFLGNMQLDKGENAALAVALQEMNDAPQALFEVYSLGFNENRDIITYLATSRGVVLLITLVLMLVAFCLWVLLMPPRMKYYLDTSGERYFTQEVFISALAGHYLRTGDWTTLYNKLKEQFKRELDQLYPGLPLEEQLRRLADSPFYDVSFESLSAAFAIMDVASEQDFIHKSQNLLSLQRKVGRYEQYQPGAVPRAAAAAVAGPADIPVDIRPGRAH